MKKLATFSVWAAAAAAMFLAGRGCGRCGGPGSYGGRGVVEVTRVDTVTVRDTLRDTILLPVERFVVRVDTVRLPAVRDTAGVESPPDSVRAAVPVERAVYATADYRAVVEGFRPALVELELYRNTAFITRETTRTPAPKRWGIGLQAGCGLGPHGLAPYIGIGVQYDLIAW